MFICKIFGLAVMVYASARLSAIAIKWLKVGLDELSPKKRIEYRKEDY